MITSADTQAIHATYCRCTKLDVKYTTYHHYVFEKWLADGNTAQELEVVCKWLWYLVGRGERTLRTFAFQSLIRDEPRYLDDLAQARAWSRAPRGHTDKTSVLESSGRPVRVVEQTAKSAGEVMRANKAFEAFREAAKNL